MISDAEFKRVMEPIIPGERDYPCQECSAPFWKVSKSNDIKGNIYYSCVECGHECLADCKHREDMKGDPKWRERYGREKEANRLSQEV